MSDGKNNPPRAAIWLLQNACPGDNEALTGDLIERFREGRTHAWFWGQVLIAFAVGVLGEIRRHSPHFCYAIAGTVIPVVVPWKIVDRLPLNWSRLPWPWSQLLLDLHPIFLLALAALPVLAAGLVINGAFRWISVFRTGVISLGLITLRYYLFEFLGPWISRPVPGDPYHRFLIIPATLQILLLFFIFLVSAWLSCPSPRHANEFERQAEA
jgi:hypothetical protein